MIAKQELMAYLEANRDEDVPLLTEEGHPELYRLVEEATKKAGLRPHERYSDRPLRGIQGKKI